MKIHIEIGLASQNEMATSIESPKIDCSHIERCRPDIIVMVKPNALPIKRHMIRQPRKVGDLTQTKTKMTSFISRTNYLFLSVRQNEV